MKKYIIPALQVADINNDALLVGSLNDEKGNGVQLAKRRARGRHNYDDVEAYDFEEEGEDF